MALLESVPNVSEGRDLAVIAAVGQAFAEQGARPRRPLRRRSPPLRLHARRRRERPGRGAARGDRHAPPSSSTCAVARRHPPAHRRSGRRADRAARGRRRWSSRSRSRSALGRRVGDELGLPVFLYGASADGLRPAFFRRGGPAELQRRIDAGELRPAFGPSRLDPRAGGVLIGARPLLIAFNIELRDGRPRRRAGDRGGDPRIEWRHGRGPGARASCCPATRACAGVRQRDRRRGDAPRRRRGARSRGSRRSGPSRSVPSELVGLLPESAVADPALLGLEALPDDRVLERRLAQGESSNPAIDSRP